MSRRTSRSMKMITVCALAGTWMATGAAHAATYYVAKTGKDSHSCTEAQNPNTPRLTIPKGVDCLAGGDTLIIKAGTYANQEITNPPAGTAGAYTVIMGDPGGPRPVILPDRAAFQRGLYCNNGSNCHHIEMRHLEVRDGHNAIKLYGTDAIGYAHHMRFVNNYFYGGGVGILIDSSTTGYIGGDHLIQGNTFEQMGRLVPGYSPGVNSIYNPGSRTIIENNTFTHCQIGVGIWHSGDGTGTGAKWIRDVIVRNNIFQDMALPLTDTWQQGQGTPVGIHISVPGGGHQIYNNLFYRSGEKDPTRNTTFYGVIVNSLNTTGISIPVHVYNNTFFDFKNASSHAVHVVAAKCSTSMCFIRNNIAYLAGGFLNGTQSKNLTEDPSFVDAAGADFSLETKSAAIDKGEALDLVTTDIRGVSRPQGVGYDIGAYEWCPEGSCGSGEGTGTGASTGTGAGSGSTSNSGTGSAGNGVGSTTAGTPSGGTGGMDGGLGGQGGGGDSAEVGGMVGTCSCSVGAPAGSRDLGFLCVAALAWLVSRQRRARG